MTMGKRLERSGEVRVVDETNGFGLHFVKKRERESRFWSEVRLYLSVIPGTRITQWDRSKRAEEDIVS